MNRMDELRRGLDARRFRTAMGRYPTGVAVVTTYTRGQGVAGLTVNSFASVSLQPLLVSWNLGRQSRWLDVFLQCPRYGINVLATDQRELARQFARHDVPRLGEQAWEPGHEVPVLRGVAAHFDCINGQHHLAGDHVILVGEVRGFSFDAGRAPLLFHAGNYHDGRNLQAPGGGRRVADDLAQD